MVSGVPDSPRVLNNDKEQVVKWLILLGLIAVPFHVQAQVYKCSQAGKTVYQGAPCSQGRPVDLTNAHAPTEEEQLNAKARAERDAALARGGGTTYKNRDEACVQLSRNASSEIEKIRAKYVCAQSGTANSSRDRECVELSRNANTETELQRAKYVCTGNSVKSKGSAGAINPKTGEFYPEVAGGVINPRTGEFMPEVAGGYVNPKTGQFIPAQ